MVARGGSIGKRKRRRRGMLAARVLPRRVWRQAATAALESLRDSSIRWTPRLRYALPGEFRQAHS